MSSFFRGVFWGALALVGVYLLAFTTMPFWLNPDKLHRNLASYGLWQNSVARRAYFSALARHGGILVLGTSESGGLSSRPSMPNYWAYWNADSSISRKMNVMAGAGNSPIMWLSALEDTPAGLPVVGIINPIYFTSALNSEASVMGYAPRYLSQHDVSLAGKALEGIPAESRVRPYVEGLLNQMQGLDTIKNTASINDIFHLAHFVDLVFLGSLKRQIPQESLSARTVYDADWSADFNVASWIVTRDNLPSMHVDLGLKDFRTSPRFKSLLAFCEYVHAQEKRVTLVLLPYNRLYFSKVSPESIGDYDAALDLIRARAFPLVDWIDLSTIVEPEGVFVDSMHFSGYGAYLVYQRLKAALGERIAIGDQR